MLLRKPSGAGPVNTAPTPSGNTWPPAPGASAAPARSQDAILAALKEELFALETERLQRRISEPDYRQAKDAIELILGRVLNRDAHGAAQPAVSSAEPLARG